MAEVTRLITGTCPKGHQRTPETAYVRSDGRISCRVCRRLLQAAVRAAPGYVPRKYKRKPKPSRARGHDSQARVVERLEEIEFMLDGSTQVAGLAERLGSTNAGTARFLYRRGRPELARKFEQLARSQREERRAA